MRRARLLLLAVPALLGIVAPARAADPTVLVAAHADGGLVKVTLTGRTATVTPLVTATRGAYHIPTQANGPSVAFVTETESGADVSVVDAGTGKHRRLTRDGRSGFLLVSRDGRYRYVLRTSSGTFFQLVRIDARNAVKTLLTLPAAAFRTGDVVLSGASLSADGRTVYVARTYESRASDVLAVDTTTGAQRVVQTGGARWVHHVVASPDGKWLAVSFAEDDFVSRVRLVPLGGGTPKDLTLPYADIFASAFSPDSTTLVLSSFVALTPDEVTPGLHLADVATGLVLPVAGTERVFQAVAVA